MFDFIKRAASAINAGSTTKVKAHVRTLPDGRQILVRKGERAATPLTKKLANRVTRDLVSKLLG